MAKKKTYRASHHGRRHAKHSHFFALHGVDHTASMDKRLMQTALETGKDLLIGVVGGGLAGAMIGKPSLLVGVLVTGAGHFSNNRLVQLVGLGMMASNGFQSSGATTNGLDGLDGVKDRLLAYKDSFSEKFYLDKFLKHASPSSGATTAGMGEVQYFTYPTDLQGDLAALNAIEDQLADSALAYQGSAGALPNEAAGWSEDGSDAHSNTGEVEDQLY